MQSSSIHIFFHLRWPIMVIIHRMWCLALQFFPNFFYHSNAILGSIYRASYTGDMIMKSLIHEESNLIGREEAKYTSIISLVNLPLCSPMIMMINLAQHKMEMNWSKVPKVIPLAFSDLELNKGIKHSNMYLIMIQNHEWEAVQSFK